MAFRVVSFPAITIRLKYENKFSTGSGSPSTSAFARTLMRSSVGRSRRYLSHQAHVACRVGKQQLLFAGVSGFELDDSPSQFALQLGDHLSQRLEATRALRVARSRIVREAVSMSDPGGGRTHQLIVSVGIRARRYCSQSRIG